MLPRLTVRRVGLAALPVVVACSVLAVYAVAHRYDGPEDGERIGSLAWSLVDVSADARTLTISHEDPDCTSRHGTPEVRESARSVFIEVPAISTGPLDDDVGCLLDLNFTGSEVRLAAPLGRRHLHQPRPDADAQRPGLASLLNLRRCRKVASLPGDAPARDVPFIQRQLRTCNEPLPHRLRPMPFLRRSASEADRLRRSDRREPEQQFFVTRPGALRGTRTPARLWLLPGPRMTCLYVAFYPDDTDSECVRSPIVARDGVFVTNEYDGCERPGFRVRMAGVVPASVRTVRLERDGRTIARPRVVDGAWAAKSRHPDVIAYGSRRLRPDTRC